MTSSGNQSEPLALVVADVGGTNGRFAIARCAGSDRRAILLSDVRSYRTAGLQSFDELMALYLAEIGPSVPRFACLAIAGPVHADRAHITNLGWSLGVERLRQRFDFQDMRLANDFAVLAEMIPLLPAGATQSLTPQLAGVPGPRSVIGPGTGLGVALVVESGSECLTVSTESGHMSFAPATQLEWELKSGLQRVLGHVSVESLLSGAGLVRIHDFLARSKGGGSAAITDPADVTRGALDGDERCCAAVGLFLSILGSVAGDIALAHGASGGVYLAGGILPRISSLVHASDFLRRFGDKGPMRDYLERIPVHLITEPHIALLGAAALYLRLAAGTDGSSQGLNT
jgi:glucokinase